MSLRACGFSTLVVLFLVVSPASSEAGRKGGHGKPPADPVYPAASGEGLTWATFLGGAGDDFAGAVADADGNIIVVGATASTDFPVTSNAFQTTHHGDRDVFVAKLAAGGKSLLWSTLLGGSGTDNAVAVCVVPGGDIVVCGGTSSGDFPVTAGAYRRTYAGGALDAFVARISSDGRQLVTSTLLGGSSSDIGLAVAMDDAGGMIVGGYTGSTDFPVTAGAIRSARAGGFYDAADGFVTRLDPSGARLTYSTYVGADAGTDEVFALAVDGAGRITVAGMTQSPDFPTTPGAFSRTFDRYWDGFVVQIDPSTHALNFATLLPGNGYDEPRAVALDAQGRVFVAGHTSSTNFPTTRSAAQRAYGGGAYDAFACVLAADGKSADYCTYLGGSGTEYGYGVGISAAGDAWLAGMTDAVNFPVTAGAYDTTPNGDMDVFLTRLSPSGSSFDYSTLIGSSGADAVRGLSLDASGGVLLAGFTGSADFPTTSGAFAEAPAGGGGNDAFVLRMDTQAMSNAMAGTYAAQVQFDGGLRTVSPAWRAAPNPFAGRTTLSLTANGEQWIRINVYDPAGRLIRTLADQRVWGGTHDWQWDGSDDFGAKVSPGVYVIDVTQGDEHSRKTVVRLH